MSDRAGGLDPGPPGPAPGNSGSGASGGANRNPEDAHGSPWVQEAAHQEKRFIAVCDAPDYCRTPPGDVPVPYQVTADLGQALSVSPDVFYQGFPLLRVDDSFIPSVTGDEHGTGGGVKSGACAGKVEFIGGSSTIRANGKRMVRERDRVAMNNRNTTGVIVSLSSVAPQGKVGPGGQVTCAPSSHRMPTAAEWKKVSRPWQPEEVSAPAGVAASPWLGWIAWLSGLGEWIRRRPKPGRLRGEPGVRVDGSVQGRQGAGYPATLAGGPVNGETGMRPPRKTLREIQAENLEACRTLHEEKRVKAFLDTLAKTEGADYDTLVGGKKFKDYRVHPNLRHETLNSTAAGRYQIIHPTWMDLSRKLGLEDFSPITQDLMAIQLLRDCGAMQPLLKGDFMGVLKKAYKKWASIPEGPGSLDNNVDPNQPYFSYESVKKIYYDNLNG